MPDIRSKLTVVPPPSADGYARAETARKNSLFRWADGVLEQIGLAEHVPGKRDQVRLRAGDLAGLAKLTLDVDAAAVTLAIQAALYPASGKPKAEHFKGIREGALKKVLKARSAELKKAREAELLLSAQSAGSQSATSSSSYDWISDLKLGSKDEILPQLEPI